MKVVFMGTPDFAIPTLDIINQSKHSLLCVVTQPDRPKGRGGKVTPPPVKKWAVLNNIPFCQPEKVRNKDFILELNRISPDLIITAAFGQILPKEILDLPSLGCINVHASLLPKYRGASPIQQALINGEHETGISIMYMDEGMDTGDIILQKKIPIYPDENAGELHDRLKILGSDLVKECLLLFEKGKPSAIPQDHKLATYCSKIDKTMGRINWNMDAVSIKNLVRGLTPWPGSFAFLGEKRLKVCNVKEWEYSVVGNYSPGEVVVSDPKKGLVVRCKESFLRLVQIQWPGSRIMKDTEFLMGKSIPCGTLLE
jgi:methionyl-tRNA formyltransferase